MSVSSGKSSLESCSDNEVEPLISPLISPIISIPGETDSEYLLRKQREEEDELLLRSLRAASANNSKMNSKLSLVSNTQLKPYNDDPEAITDEPELHLYGPDHLHNRTTPGNRRPSITNSIADSITNSLIQAKDFTIYEMRKRRFLIVSIFSIFCILIFDLIFLPRTSLDRDLRRLHGKFLTFNDCSRLYLTHLNFKNNIKNYLEIYEDELHIPGENYISTENLFNSFANFKVSTEKYEVWMGSPQDNHLQLLDTNGKVLYDANIQETEMLSFYPYSADGTVQAQYIYLNYGNELDYQLLEKNSIDVKNRIVIIRTDHIHPSLKIKLAELKGASAVVIYSDPYDDGKFTENNGYQSFPLGFARNRHSIDKFTSSYIYNLPGDPTTPGWSSTLFSKRIEPDTIPKIPVISISHGSIQPILKELSKGPNLGWEGDILNFDYFPGPSSLELLLLNEIDYSIEPIYNIITTIPGIISDEEIIIGASRDVIGGVGGASSGHATLLEIARGFNELKKRGWKPLRTIKLISWDGSSYGQLGSTEYGEFYARSLSSNAIIYINLDGVSGSKLNVEANPLFRNLLEKNLKEILFDEDTTLDSYFANGNGTIELISQKVDDSSVFQNHLGVPVLNVGFIRDEMNDPVDYTNSKYDTIKWVEKFDPDLKLHNVIAQFVGLFVLNLTEKEILTIKTEDYMRLIRRKFIELHKKTPDYWLERKIDFDPYKSGIHDRIGEELDYLNDLLKKLVEISKKFDDNLKDLQVKIIQDYPWFKLFKKIKTAIEIKINNAKIKALDRMFIADLIFTKTNDEGKGEGFLKGRVWFRHLIFAPSDSDKGVDLLPGLSASIQNEDFQLYVKNLVALRISLERVIEKL